MEKHKTPWDLSGIRPPSEFDNPQDYAAQFDRIMSQPTSYTRHRRLRVEAGFLAVALIVAFVLAVLRK